MDESSLTDALRRAAAELPVDDTPPVAAIEAGRRRILLRRGILTATVIAAVLVAVVVIGAKSTARSPRGQTRTIDTSPSPGRGKGVGTAAATTVPPTAPTSASTSQATRATTIPPVETADPQRELFVRIDGGHLLPVATGTTRGVPWRLYLLDARTPDGVTECVLMSVGTPGRGGGASCRKPATVSSPRPDGVDQTTCSAADPATNIAFGIVPEAGRFVWSDDDPGAASRLPPGASVPPGDHVAPTQTVQTPFGTRIIVVYGYPGDC